MVGSDGEQHESLIGTLGREFNDLHRRGMYREATNIAIRLRDLVRNFRGENSTHFAGVTHNLAVIYAKIGNYSQAEELYLKALEIWRKTIGVEHGDAANCLNGLGSLYSSMGNFAKAEEHYLEALKIWRKHIAKEDSYVATFLNNLGTIYYRVGSYAKAEEHYLEAVTISVKRLGTQHPNVARYMKNLGLLYYSTGKYTQAEELYLKSLEIWRKTLGDEHPDVATCLDNLGMLYFAVGNYAKAEELYLKALEIRRKVLGSEHHHVGNIMNSLASVYLQIGSYAKAEELYLKALAIVHKAVGEEHPDVGACINSLAQLYYRVGNNLKAEELYLKSLEIWRKTLGEEHPDVASSISGLALIYAEMGNYAKAEELYLKSLEIQRKTLGEEHPDVASSIHALAVMFFAVGNFAKAEELYLKALEIRRKVLGQEHLDTVNIMKNLAYLFAATDRTDEAMILMENVVLFEDRMIGHIFSMSSENQRMAYLQTLESSLHAYLSLVLRYFSTSSKSRRIAFELVLRRKGIGTEAFTVQRDLVLGGKYPKLRQELGELNVLRTQIAQKTLAGPGYEGLAGHENLLAELNEQKENLEAELARQIPEMKLEKLQVVNSQVLAEALPEGSILVEFIRFNILDFDASLTIGNLSWKPAHYLAFILRARKSDNVELVDMGEAKSIEDKIALFRTSITGQSEIATPPRSPSLSLEINHGERVSVGNALSAMVFAPMVPTLTGCRRLFIAPDSDLTKLPFEVLPTKDGHRLIDIFGITYLSTGRDILNWGDVSDSTDPVVAADPDFDLRLAQPSSSGKSPSGRRQAIDFEMKKLSFDRLPGTRKEAMYIAKLLRVKPWLGRDFLEARVKTQRSPSILHLATHGFFLPNRAEDFSKDKAKILGKRSDISGMIRTFPRMRPENPLLRSGLALAGANSWIRGDTPPEEAEDGILTAEDVTTMDLLGTQLVVLSACETGLGEIRTGEGVFGLRRAFVLAGAQTLVMSLWKVSDKATQELMESFYDNLVAGESRADALREAQLVIKAKYANPYFWGGFILQGNPTRLSKLQINKDVIS